MNIRLQNSGHQTVVASFIPRVAGKANRVPSHRVTPKHHLINTEALFLILSNEWTLSPFVVFVDNLNLVRPVTLRAVHLASPTVLPLLLPLEDRSSRLLTSALPLSSKMSRRTDVTVNKSILTLSPTCTRRLPSTDTRSVAAASIPPQYRRLLFNQSR